MPTQGELADRLRAASDEKTSLPPMEPATPAESPRPRERWTRRLRIRVGGWILREAATFPGAAGIVILSFLGSAFVPIMLEPFLIVLTTNLPHLWRRFAFCFALGSVLGGVATYVIGYTFVATVGMSIVRFWGEEAAFEQLLASARSSWWLIPVALVAVGPGPMKLVTMAAGAAKLAFVPFLAVLIAGRIVRFYSVSYFSRVFGKQMHEWYVAGRKRPVYIATAALALALTGAYLLARAIIF